MMKAKEYIRGFDILLFDMGRTFMFGGDVFDNGQNYEKSYNSFGGKYLNNERLREYINYIFSSLLTRSRDPLFQDHMITVEELIMSDNYFNGLESEDKILLEKVFAYHECGAVPESCRKTLENLSKTHKLGLISNFWCKSEYFIDQLKRDGVFEFFDLTIFSSDYGMVKPSKKIFKMAAIHFNMKSNEIVYIGDNYKRDVVGSKNAGMKSILVNNSESSKITGDIIPDCIITKIEELVQ